MAEQAHGLKLIDELPLEGKRTLMRVDFNVPLEDGRTDDSRIRAACPASAMPSNGARLILTSHLVD